jgi:uncharacterized protein YjbI with pentapeptide repeats
MESFESKLDVANLDVSPPGGLQPFSHDLEPSGPEDFELSRQSPSLADDRRWWLTVLAMVAAMLVGLLLQWAWVGVPAAIALMLLTLPVTIPPIKRAFLSSIFGQRLELLLSWLLFVAAVAGVLQLTGVLTAVNGWSKGVNWEALGAVGQIAIAIVALWVAWQQVRTSVQLTSQQNLITQQQTIDAYFQGISDLVLDEAGQLEDWPLERAIAAGRTAAILRGSDAAGKAKVLRFLSVANLLSPLRRDEHLGRPILDGKGWYQRDRLRGIKVVDLGAMLASTSLAGTDLRGIDLSDINLVGTNLAGCDLSYTNFVMAHLAGANLQGADVQDTLFFLRDPTIATPYKRGEKRDFKTGKNTGAVVKDADFTGAISLSDEQRYYICAWGGDRTRATVPGGCEGIPDRLAKQPEPR